jgi:hypothetical protein
MTEATCCDGRTPKIDRRMSAVLANVQQGQTDLPEATSLRSPLRERTGFDPEHRQNALLTSERAVRIKGASSPSLSGDTTAALAERPLTSRGEG